MSINEASKIIGRSTILFGWGRQIEGNQGQQANHGRDSANKDKKLAVMQESAQGQTNGARSFF